MYTHLYYYAIENTQISRKTLKLSIFHAKKVVLRNVGNFEVHITRGSIANTGNSRP